MMTREQWILAFSVATFIVVVVSGCILYLRTKRQERTDTDTILDAIDGTRDSVDMHAQNTMMEHKAMDKKLDRVIGQNQFMMADKIWAEKEQIKQERAAKDQAEKDAKP